MSVGHGWGQGMGQGCSSVRGLVCGCYVIIWDECVCPGWWSGGQVVRGLGEGVKGQCVSKVGLSMSKVVVVVVRLCGGDGQVAAVSVRGVVTGCVCVCVSGVQEVMWSSRWLVVIALRVVVMVVA